MKYTKYHSTTGEVTSLLTTTDATSLQANLPDEHYLEGHYHPDGHYIDVATKTAIAKPAKPSSTHTWDVQNKTWVADTTKVGQAERAIRNHLLSAVDRVNPIWFSGLSNDQKLELAVYRTSLLNVPQQSSFPTTIEWPTKPTWL
jgi:hypothetical protein